MIGWRRRRDDIDVLSTGYRDMILAAVYKWDFGLVLSYTHLWAKGLGVTIFDINTITRDQLPAHPEYFSSDGFHPSDQGYELWASEMWPTLARVIGE